MNIPSTTSLNPKITRPLPPLPHVSSASIRTKIFTHRSYYARPTHVFEDRLDDLSPDNERLEHLGDAVVGLLVTEMIQEMYTGLRVGPATKMRALVVGNPTLAAISQEYHLPDRLRVHPAQAITLRASPNIQADTFEAYCGGVFLERGVEGMKAWFQELFRPWVEEAYREMKTEHYVTETSDDINPQLIYCPPLDNPSHRAPPPALQAVGHLSLFNQTLAQKNKVVEWTFEDIATQPRTPMWKVEARIHGRCVGTGRGGTKKAAKNEAARDALVYLGIYKPPPGMLIDPEAMIELSSEPLLDAVMIDTLSTVGPSPVHHGAEALHTGFSASL